MAKSGALAEQILGHQGACVTFSSRADLFDLTAGTRANLGPLRIFNPFGVGGLPSSLHWDLFGGYPVPRVHFVLATALGGASHHGHIACWLDHSSDSRAPCIIYVA